MAIQTAAPNPNVTPALTLGLKEWAIALEAIWAGETICLLRKGGIQERQFTLEQSRLWLLPTYEHQDPELVKPQYRDRIQRVPSGWHPDHLSIQGWADITHHYNLTDPDSLQALAPFHIWTEALAETRRQWKPQQPLQILCLRGHRLTEPWHLPYQSSYSGCKSWLNLPADLTIPSLHPSQPVLDDDLYQQQVAAIAQACDTQPSAC